VQWIDCDIGHDCPVVRRAEGSGCHYDTMSRMFSGLTGTVYPGVYGVRQSTSVPKEVPIGVP